MKVNSTILVPSAILLFFVLFFALVYAPVTQGHYFISEDYVRIWTTDWKGGNQQSFISYIHDDKLQLAGRLLENLYYYVAFNKYINSLKSVEAANTVRFIGIIGIGLFAFILYLIFKENRFRTSHAFILSILICTLPPVQTYVSKVFLGKLIYGVLLSAVSALILFKVIFKEDRKKTAHIAIAVLMAMVLFVFAMNFYQPAAMVYWSMGIIPLIKLKNENFIKKWRLPFTIYFLTGIAAMIVYLEITKFIYFLMDSQLAERGNFFINERDLYPPSDLHPGVRFRHVLVHPVLWFEKWFLNIASNLWNIVSTHIIWFIKYPLYIASNLWNIVRSIEVALFVSFIIFAGLLYDFGRVMLQTMAEKKRFNLLLNFLCRYSLILILIPLSYAANLAVKYYDIAPTTYHRILIGPEIVILLLLYWGLMNIADFFKSALHFSDELLKKIITIGLIILTIATAFLANYNVDKYFVKFSTDELRYMENVIKEYGVSKLSKASKIYIISDGNLNDIKGFTFASSSSNAYAISMAKVALHELGINLDIPITFISTYEVPSDNEVLIIAMQYYQEKTDNKSYLPKTLQSLYEDILKDKQTLIIDMTDFQKKTYKKLNLPLIL